MSLIVEDDPMVASSLGDVLAIAGVPHVELAGNGDTAMRALASGRRLDLALVDLMIPPATGLTVAVDALRRNIPVLLTSSDLARRRPVAPQSGAEQVSGMTSADRPPGR